MLVFTSGDPRLGCLRCTPLRGFGRPVVRPVLVVRVAGRSSDRWNCVMYVDQSVICARGLDMRR